MLSLTSIAIALGSNTTSTKLGSLTSGVFMGWCGTGSGNGTLANFDPNQEDILTVSGSLNLRDFSCTVPVEERSWGAVKAIYSD